MAESAKVTNEALRRRRLAAVAVFLSVLVLAFAVVVPPHALLDKADMPGYAVCHRIPERSFILGGRQLPLCARCTGTFLGAMVGLFAMILLRRHKASRMPPVSVLAMLVVFVGFWAFDGLNSYLALILGNAPLYEPQNWLRLATGLLNGLALIIIVLPILNFTLWRNTVKEPVIRSVWELLAFLPVLVLFVLVIQAEVGFLLYPLAIASSLGVVVMLALINAMIAAVVLGREGYARTWRQAAVPVIVGAALALLLIAGMVLLRDYLTTTLGLPF